MTDRYVMLEHRRLFGEAPNRDLGTFNLTHG